MPKGPRPAERYRLKYSRLRRAARALVFENGALCDEVARLEAKWLRARDERRFLLTRLLQLRALAGSEEVSGEVVGRRPRRGGWREGGKDGARSTGARDGSRDGARSTGGRDGAKDGARSTGSRDGSRDELRPTGSRDGSRDGSRSTGSRDGSRDELRPMGPRDGPRDELRPTGPRPVGSRPPGWRDGPGAGSRPTVPRDEPRDGQRPPGPRDGPRDDLRLNGPRSGPKLDVPPTAILRPPEDASSPVGPPAAILRPPPRRRAGALTLPLVLGPLTVHSLGAGGGGVGPAAILPLGFRSTRLFASTRRPARRCLYTCRIVAGPRCEIVCEDEPGRVLVGPTPDVCHGRLLQALGEAGGRPRAMPPGAGADFFGLTHPAVRRLLQGEAGAFLHPEEEEEEEEEDEDDDDDDEEDDEEEEEEEGAAPAFTYADVFLGSPTGSDE